MIEPLIHEYPTQLPALGVSGPSTLAAVTATSVTDSGPLSETGMINPTGLTGTLNDWAPTGFSGARHVYLSATGGTTISGIAGGSDGRVITLISDPAAGFTTSLLHESASSSAANRIQLIGNNTWALNPSTVSVLMLRYNGTAQRWQQLNGTSTTVNATTTFGGVVNFNSAIAATSTVTPTALASGSTNDWSPSTGFEFRTTPAAGGSTVTSIATNVANGRVIVITNISTGLDPIILKHDDGASGTAANRFLFPYNQSIVIPPGGSAILRYDGTSSRWRPIDTPPQLNAPFAMPMQSGRYYFVPNITSTASVAPPNGSLRLAPFWVPNLVTVQRIGAEVTVIGDVGSKVRLGIYADDGTGRPGTLLLDAGQIAGDSATVQEITGLSLVLPPGVYWTAQVVQSVTTTAPTLRVSSNQGVLVNVDAGTTIPAANAAFASFSQSGVTGALPASTSALVGAANNPRCFIKVA